MERVISVSNETDAVFSRTTMDGRKLTYKLRVIQQPERARACGSGAKCMYSFPRHMANLVLSRIQLLLIVVRSTRRLLSSSESLKGRMQTRTLRFSLVQTTFCLRPWSRPVQLLRDASHKIRTASQS